jgi:hypothetical protein
MKAEREHDSYRLAHRHDVARRFVVRGGKLVGSKVRIANHAAGPHQLGRSWLDGYLDGAAGRHVAKLSPVSH